MSEYGFHSSHFSAVKSAVICSSRLTTKVVLESEGLGLSIVCFLFPPINTRVYQLLGGILPVFMPGSGGTRDATKTVEKS